MRGGDDLDGGYHGDQFMFVFLLILLTLLGMNKTACATSLENDALHSWFDQAILGKGAPPIPMPGLLVRRQDYNTLQINRSVMKTPLQIGARKFPRGLGTHSVSEILVRLPEAASEFSALVGIDNNYDTQGKRGSVIFAVEANGKELYRSGICRGGEAPVTVKVTLPGVKLLTLRVLDDGDGPGWDQSDWVEAKVLLDNGKELFLDELPIDGSGTGLGTDLPFSFTYDGKSSADLLPAWKRELESVPAEDDRERHTLRYTDPITGLQLICEITRFTDYPAVDWVLYFKNTGATDTPILEHVEPLDMKIKAPDGRIILHRAHGSTCSATDFLPIDEEVGQKADIQFAPNGGRSSNGALPFFNLEWDAGGVVGAIGWSGQWAARLQRSDAQLWLQAGQQTTHLKLHPGESIRTPRILLVSWQGTDRLHGHNLLRRLLLDHYVPRVNGEIALPPVTQNTWFAFNEGNNVTEKNQFEAMPAMVAAGVEGYWLDAGWFEGGWPAGAGSWVPKKEAFPNGLKPVGDEAHRLGMKFVLWFEPERVTPNSRVAKEHPEWVMKPAGDNALFALGEPKACEWLTDYLSRCIADWGIDIYRNDFNIDPLPFWQAADAPDRQGMAEIRYIENLYTMWDDLRRRKPGLTIDNCASGGRRIDLETISRSYPLWQSDTQCCGKPMPVWDQVQNAGLSLYVPLHSAGVWAFDPYQFRSIATTGTSICSASTDKETLAQARKMTDQEKLLRPLYLGDYYPLFETTLNEHDWCGWQYDRPESGAGFALLFRRDRSPYTAVDVQLRGLDSGSSYTVENVDTGEKRTLTGEAMSKQFKVEIPEAPGSVLMRYQKVR